MVSKTRILLSFQLMLLFGFQAFGQISFDSREELEKAANQFFETQNYTKAKPLFSQLLSKDALDPNYNYRFGVCIMFTEADPLKPLPYIEGGAITKGVNTEAHYFLGRSYQLNYRFDDAILAFEKGKKAGFSNPNINLDKSIAECRNGKILYNSAIDFNPVQNKEAIANEFYRPYDFRKLKGKVIPMPLNFKTKYDEKNLTGTFIYTPTNSRILVYASLGMDGANGKDLYKVNRLPSGEWALPQRLPPTINTKYDEDHAFFDETTNTLYFASKGHNTMGGYDVFSSRYNSKNNSWSTPLNLQYPTNSPYDDFLYVSDPNGRMAFFTSSRSTVPGKLRVFKTLLYDAQQVALTIVEGTFNDKTDSAYNYMSATVLDPITGNVVGKYRSHSVTGKYLLILPPQNDYKFAVGPKEAEGFKFDLDVPKHDPFTPLKQGVSYTVSTTEGTATMTNFFDGKGNPDSIVFTQSKPLNEIQERMVAMANPNELAAVKTGGGENINAESAALALQKKQAAAIATAEVLTLKKKEAEALKAQQQLAAQRQKTKQDSITTAEVLALKKKEDEKAAIAKQKKEMADLKATQQLAAQRKKARQDSIAEADRKAAITAEKARLTQISNEVEAAKQQAMQEALAAGELSKNEESVAVEQEIEFNELLKEMQQQERELLKEQEAAAKAALQQQVSTDPKALEEATELAKAEEASVSKTELEAAKKAAENEAVEETVSEVKTEEVSSNASVSDLFLEAIAKAEEQQLKKVVIAKQEEQKAKLTAPQLIAEQKQQAAELMAQQKLIEQQKNAVQNSIAAAQTLVVEKEKEKAVIERQEEQKARLAAQQLIAEQKQQAAELMAQRKLIAQQKKAVQDSSQAAADLAQVKANLPIVAKEKEVDTEATENPVTETSEADLFLATIAKLEAQMAERDAQIEAETQVDILAREQKIAAAELAEEQAIAEAQNAVIATDSTVSDTTNLTIAKAVTMPKTNAMEEMAALKSNVNPNEYLAAINKIENEIRKDAAARPNKDYTLRNIDEPNQKKTTRDDVTDPALQLKIAEDRKALEAHQKLAIEKERELNDRIQRDKDVLELYDDGFADELKNAENEIPAATDNAAEAVKQETENNVAIVSLEIAETEVETSTDNEEKEGANNRELSDILKEMQAAEQQLKLQETEAKNAVAETKTKTEETVASASGAEISKPISIEVVVETTKETAEETMLEETAAQTIEPVETEAEKVEVAILQKEKETLQTVVLEEKKTMVTELISEPEKTKNALLPMAQKREATVGTIPFLTATKRHPSNQKPLFNNIKDSKMRSLIKRMRGEDIGRLAVLKNMNNQKIDAAEDETAIKTIQENRRNKEVLENAQKRVARKEYVRPRFNKNDLKQRKEVYYKLVFIIKTVSVSETIENAMKPELLATFTMPEFDLQSGHFTTLADARSEYHHYRGRGFEDVQIVPYLRGEKVMLSDVEKIPFIE